jgi:hypothetical protein
VAQKIETAREPLLGRLNLASSGASEAEIEAAKNRYVIDRAAVTGEIATKQIAFSTVE